MLTLDLFAAANLVCFLLNQQTHSVYLPLRTHDVTSWLAFTTCTTTLCGYRT